jgi:uncharacterized coiled-coil protein SlyX
MQSHFGQQRPPYVEFETRVQEDRAQTIAVGSFVGKDVDFAIIRAIGAKDAVEKEVGVWLPQIKALAQQGDWPREWVKFYEEQYAAYKEGNNADAIVNGTHVKNWTALSPAQLQMLIAARILTVEDVAAANEETLARIGMGARGLKQRAQAWLDSRNSGAEELAMLREKTANQDETIETLRGQVAQLVARLDKLEPEPEDEQSDAQATPQRSRRRA